MDNLRLLAKMLEKAENSEDITEELNNFLNYLNFVNKKNQKLKLKDILTICEDFKFNINTYNFTDNKFPGMPLQKYIETNNVDNEVEFFTFLKEFTDKGNFVSFEEKSKNNFVIGKMTSLTYVGRI